ncbi:protein kintoun [Stomoxys calcitrans]|uniref:protein kintoun n=1 Tax=Stomoxys calcitrans TaxID=35570 RepID=UPI0027E28DD8|nr:protein kintoun [Stomoxys calcitrans]
MSSATSVSSAHTKTPQLSQARQASAPKGPQPAPPPSAQKQSSSSSSSSSPSPPQLDITNEEYQRLSEAFKKEEFRKLFLDYVEEIQDPDNRKRYEEEIVQIEAERGVDVIFVHPEPGFVIKTSQNGEQKCFINCAKNSHVGKPSSQVCVSQSTGQKGLSWSIPMAQAPPRDDLDNNKKRCRVYDVVFHPDALYLAEKNATFHKCLVDTAIDAVEREYKVSLDRINVKFPKLQYKGLPRPTVIRKLAVNPPVETEEPHPLDSIYPAKPTCDAGQPKVLPMKTMDSAINGTTNNKISEYCTPKYTLKHRHDVDLSQYTNELDAKLHATTPRELVLDIELPLLNSSNECQLDVTDKTVFLLSDRTGAKYRLNVDLPFRVSEKNGSAKFDTDRRHLVITLPVIQPPIAKQREMHESLLHINREDSGVESDVLNEDLHSSHTESPIEELSSASFDESLQHAVRNDTINAEGVFLKPNLDYQLPAKFDCNVLDNTMSFILQVRNVQEESLKMKRQDRLIHMQFSSLGSGYYPTYYAFCIQLSEAEAEAKIVDAQAEAWENNVILNVHLNQSAEKISSYLAGLDSEDLKECWLHGKGRMIHKSRQRQKSPKDQLQQQQHNLDITIERSECDKSIDIEIKSRAMENSTCNANTTEDELNAADGSSQQFQKKLNKKQKRKNKKRRSLSESACDDIKAYQQEQEQQHQQQQQHHYQQSTRNMPVPEVAENDEDADDDEDSSPERSEKLPKSPLHNISSSMNVPSVANGGGLHIIGQQRKQRSFSESRDSAISLSAGSTYKGILKHYSRYAPRPSISDSCSSIDECSSNYSTSVDGMTSAFNSMRFSQSFSDIPEENVVGLSESCKKTVRFSEVIRKQVFRFSLQPMTPLETSASDSSQYFKAKNKQNNNGNSNNNNNNNNNKIKANDKKSNNKNNRARLESESSSDVDNHKNSMMFEMDM